VTFTLAAVLFKAVLYEVLRYCCFEILPVVVVEYWPDGVSGSLPQA